MTRISIHCKYLKDSSLADWELTILHKPRGENSLDQLLPGRGNIPRNSVSFLAQYVSFLLNFQLFLILKFSLLPLHLSDSFHLFPFCPHYCFCCYSSHFVVSLADCLPASHSFSSPHPCLLLIFLILRTGLGAV